MNEPPSYWHVVRLLLAASFRRAMGRRRRQRELFSQRAGKRINFGGLGFLFGAVLLAALHVIAALAVASAVTAGEQKAAERQGLVVVDQWFIDAVSSHPPSDADGLRRGMGRFYRTESARIAERDGGDAAATQARLRQSVREHGAGQLVSRSQAAPGLAGLGQAGRLPGLLGSLVLLVWCVMMVFQGEGLELDTQRRRHPMWEWLFSHPVPHGAVFLAEMLSPVAANPVYFSAPLFPGILFGLLYGKAAGILAAIVIGIPVTLAASCLGKALEVAVTLRVSPRSRGAMIGVMGWLGYATMIGLVFAAAGGGKLFLSIAEPLAPMAILPWPWLGWFLGVLPDGTVSLLYALMACLVASSLIIAASIRFSVWGAARGLTGNPGADAAPTRRLRQSAGFAGDALFRKEIMWFVRDRSALVQAVLIPLSLAGFQVFNLRGFLMRSGQPWNALCGAAVVFGTYFLLVLGPKSLASEGAALWITLTWPDGLERLLRAKARLWALLATGIVFLVLIYAMLRYPGDWWRIALLGAAWILFARSLAAKTVTLATVTSEAGEIQKAPSGRRWAAQLGLLTFTIGVLSQQWNLVVVGVVYSALTAAAMWQNFRARLPYLYDRWSEVLPEPPTLMHAMVAISALVELGAAVTGVLLVFVPREQVAVAHAAIYGLCAAAVSAGTAEFLRRRGVALPAIWTWHPSWRGTGVSGLGASLLAGAGLGAVLGGVGLGYVALIQLWPEAADQMRHASALMQSVPHLHQSYFVMAVLIAPFAEEFLFRGLLYRALDREWGGWRAVFGSAGFFAMYHPALSWAPVFLLGAANAVLFRRTGRLAPAVLAHMTYNAIVLG